MASEREPPGPMLRSMASSVSHILSRADDIERAMRWRYDASCGSLEIADPSEASRAGVDAISRAQCESTMIRGSDEQRCLWNARAPPGFRCQSGISDIVSQFESLSRSVRALKEEMFSLATKGTWESYTENLERVKADLGVKARLQNDLVETIRDASRRFSDQLEKELRWCGDGWSCGDGEHCERFSAGECHLRPELLDPIYPLYFEMGSGNRNSNSDNGNSNSDNSDDEEKTGIAARKTIREGDRAMDFENALLRVVRELSWSPNPRTEIRFRNPANDYSSPVKRIRALNDYIAELRGDKTQEARVRQAMEQIGAIAEAKGWDALQIEKARRAAVRQISVKTSERQAEDQLRGILGYTPLDILARPQKPPENRAETLFEVEMLVQTAERATEKARSRQEEAMAQIEVVRQELARVREIIARQCSVPACDNAGPEDVECANALSLTCRVPGSCAATIVGGGGGGEGTSACELLTSLESDWDALQEEVTAATKAIRDAENLRRQQQARLRDLRNEYVELRGKQEERLRENVSAWCREFGPPPLLFRGGGGASAANIPGCSMRAWKDAAPFDSYEGPLRMTQGARKWYAPGEGSDVVGRNAELTAELNKSAARRDTSEAVSFVFATVGEMYARLMMQMCGFQAEPENKSIVFVASEAVAGWMAEDADGRVPLAGAGVAYSGVSSQLDVLMASLLGRVRALSFDESRAQVSLPDFDASNPEQTILLSFSVHVRVEGVLDGTFRIERLDGKWALARAENPMPAATAREFRNFLASRAVRRSPSAVVLQLALSQLLVPILRHQAAAEEEEALSPEGGEQADDATMPPLAGGGDAEILALANEGGPVARQRLLTIAATDPSRREEAQEVLAILADMDNFEEDEVLGPDGMPLMTTGEAGDEPLGPDGMPLMTGEAGDELLGPDGMPPLDGTLGDGEDEEDPEEARRRLEVEVRQAAAEEARSLSSELLADMESGGDEQSDESADPSPEQLVERVASDIPDAGTPDMRSQMLEALTRRGARRGPDGKVVTFYEEIVAQLNAHREWISRTETLRAWSEAKPFAEEIRSAGDAIAAAREKRTKHQIRARGESETYREWITGFLATACRAVMSREATETGYERAIREGEWQRLTGSVSDGDRVDEAVDDPNFVSSGLWYRGTVTRVLEGTASRQWALRVDAYRDMIPSGNSSEDGWTRMRGEEIVFAESDLVRVWAEDPELWPKNTKPAPGGNSRRAALLSEQAPEYVSQMRGIVSDGAAVRAEVMSSTFSIPTLPVEAYATVNRGRDAGDVITDVDGDLVGDLEAWRTAAAPLAETHWEILGLDLVDLVDRFRNETDRQKLRQYLAVFAPVLNPNSHPNFREELAWSSVASMLEGDWHAFDADRMKNYVKGSWPSRAEAEAFGADDETLRLSFLYRDGRLRVAVKDLEIPKNTFFRRGGWGYRGTHKYRITDDTSMFAVDNVLCQELRMDLARYEQVGRVAPQAGWYFLRTRTTVDRWIERGDNRKRPSVADSVVWSRIASARDTSRDAGRLDLESVADIVGTVVAGHRGKTFETPDGQSVLGVTGVREGRVAGLIALVRQLHAHRISDNMILPSEDGGCAVAVVAGSGRVALVPLLNPEDPRAGGERVWSSDPEWVYPKRLEDAIVASSGVASPESYRASYEAAAGNGDIPCWMRVPEFVPRRSEKGTWRVTSNPEHVATVAGSDSATTSSSSTTLLPVYRVAELEPVRLRVRCVEEVSSASSESLEDACEAGGTRLVRMRPRVGDTGSLDLQRMSRDGSGWEEWPEDNTAEDSADQSRRAMAEAAILAEARASGGLRVNEVARDPSSREDYGGGGFPPSWLVLYEVSVPRRIHTVPASRLGVRRTLPRGTIVKYDRELQMGEGRVEKISMVGEVQIGSDDTLLRRKTFVCFRRPTTRPASTGHAVSDFFDTDQLEDCGDRAPPPFVVGDTVGVAFAVVPAREDDPLAEVDQPRAAQRIVVRPRARDEDEGVFMRLYYDREARIVTEGLAGRHEIGDVGEYSAVRAPPRGVVRKILSFDRNHASWLYLIQNPDNPCQFLVSWDRDLALLGEVRRRQRRNNRGGSVVLGPRGWGDNTSKEERLRAYLRRPPTAAVDDDVAEAAPSPFRTRGHAAPAFPKNIVWADPSETAALGAPDLIARHLADAHALVVLEDTTLEYDEDLRVTTGGRFRGCRINPEAPNTVAHEGRRRLTLLGQLGRPAPLSLVPSQMTTGLSLKVATGSVSWAYWTRLVAEPTAAGAIEFKSRADDMDDGATAKAVADHPESVNAQTMARRVTAIDPAFDGAGVGVAEWVSGADRNVRFPYAPVDLDTDPDGVRFPRQQSSSRSGTSVWDGDHTYEVVVSTLRFDEDRSVRLRSIVRAVVLERALLGFATVSGRDTAFPPGEVVQLGGRGFARRGALLGNGGGAAVRPDDLLACLVRGGIENLEASHLDLLPLPLEDLVMDWKTSGWKKRPRRKVRVHTNEWDEDRREWKVVDREVDDLDAIAGTDMGCAAVTIRLGIGADGACPNIEVPASEPLSAERKQAIDDSRAAQAQFEETESARTTTLSDLAENIRNSEDAAKSADEAAQAAETEGAREAARLNVELEKIRKRAEAEVTGLRREADAEVRGMRDEAARTRRSGEEKSQSLKREADEKEGEAGENIRDAENKESEADQKRRESAALSGDIDTAKKALKSATTRAKKTRQNVNKNYLLSGGGRGGKKKKNNRRGGSRSPSPDRDQQRRGIEAERVRKHEAAEAEVALAREVLDGLALRGRLLVEGAEKLTLDAETLRSNSARLVSEASRARESALEETERSESKAQALETRASQREEELKASIQSRSSELEQIAQAKSNEIVAATSAAEAVVGGHRRRAEVERDQASEGRRTGEALTPASCKDTCAVVPLPAVLCKRPAYLARVPRDQLVRSNLPPGLLYSVCAYGTQLYDPPLHVVLVDDDDLRDYWGDGSGNRSPARYMVVRDARRTPRGAWGHRGYARRLNGTMVLSDVAERRPTWVPVCDPTLDPLASCLRVPEETGACAPGSGGLCRGSWRAPAEVRVVNPGTPREPGYAPYADPERPPFEVPAFNACSKTENIWLCNYRAPGTRVPGRAFAVGEAEATRRPMGMLDADGGSEDEDSFRHRLIGRVLGPSVPSGSGDEDRAYPVQFAAFPAVRITADQRAALQENQAVQRANLNFDESVWRERWDRCACPDETRTGGLLGKMPFFASGDLGVTITPRDAELALGHDESRGQTPWPRVVVRVFARESTLAAVDYANETRQGSCLRFYDLAGWHNVYPEVIQVQNIESRDSRFRSAIAAEKNNNNNGSADHSDAGGAEAFERFTQNPFLSLCAAHDREAARLPETDREAVMWRRGAGTTEELGAIIKNTTMSIPGDGPEMDFSIPAGSVEAVWRPARPACPWLREGAEARLEIRVDGASNSAVIPFRGLDAPGAHPLHLAFWFNEDAIPTGIPSVVVERVAGADREPPRVWATGLVRRCHAALQRLWCESQPAEMVGDRMSLLRSRPTQDATVVQGLTLRAEPSSEDVPRLLQMRDVMVKFLGNRLTYYHDISLNAVQKTFVRPEDADRVLERAPEKASPQFKEEYQKLTLDQKIVRSLCQPFADGLLFVRNRDMLNVTLLQYLVVRTLPVPVVEEGMPLWLGLPGHPKGEFVVGIVSAPGNVREESTACRRRAYERCALDLAGSGGSELAERVLRGSTHPDVESLVDLFPETFMEVYAKDQGNEEKPVAVVGLWRHLVLRRPVGTVVGAVCDVVRRESSASVVPTGQRVSVLAVDMKSGATVEDTVACRDAQDLGSLPRYVRVHLNPGDHHDGINRLYMEKHNVSFLNMVGTGLGITEDAKWDALLGALEGGTIVLEIDNRWKENDIDIISGVDHLTGARFNFPVVTPAWSIRAITTGVELDRLRPAASEAQKLAEWTHDVVFANSNHTSAPAQSTMEGFLRAYRAGCSVGKDRFQPLGTNGRKLEAYLDSFFPLICGADGRTAGSTVENLRALAETAGVALPGEVTADLEMCRTGEGHAAYVARWLDCVLGVSSGLPLLEDPSRANLIGKLWVDACLRLTRRRKLRSLGLHEYLVDDPCGVPRWRACVAREQWNLSSSLRDWVAPAVLGDLARVDDASWTNLWGWLLATTEDLRPPVTFASLIMEIINYMNTKGVPISSVFYTKRRRES